VPAYTSNVKFFAVFPKYKGIYYEQRPRVPGAGGTILTVIFAAMAVYSIIVPSYNQVKFIGETLENLSLLKTEAAKNNIGVELIVVDNCSDEPTLDLIRKYKGIIDLLIVEKDKGQYDAINKGLAKIKGEYWTWLNTDDLIDVKGFLEIAAYLKKNPGADYIYGDVAYIDERSQFHKNSSTPELSLDRLLRKDASISQPGSFFRTAFTEKIGNLAPYHFAFDYEYIIRCLKNHALVVKLDTTVAYFRYYRSSKSGSQDYRFLQEQKLISRQHGRSFFTMLGFMLTIRILKRRLFNA